MTMDRNGVNEYIDDDYSNSTCDCKFCKEKESLRKVLITEQEGDDIIEYAPMGSLRVTINAMDREYEDLEEMIDYTFVDDYDDFSFDLVWDDTQKPEPHCDCDSCKKGEVYTFAEEYTPEEKRRVAEFKAEVATLRQNPKEDPMEEALGELFMQRLRETDDTFCHASVRYDECDCEECEDDACDCEEPCDVCSCHEGILLDIEDEIQAAEFCEVLADEVESAMIEVLYAFETGEPKFGTLKKIDELRDLLYAMECVVISEE